MKLFIVDQTQSPGVPSVVLATVYIYIEGSQAGLEMDPEEVLRMDFRTKPQQLQLQAGYRSAAG